MFHSAALKLTGWYLLIVMSLSVGLSAVIYHISSSDLGRDARRQVAYFNGFLGPEDLENYAQLKQNQLEADRNHIKNRLVVFNLIILAGGGIASYALARRTLEPIEQSLETQKRFTADASHELRTPLTAIQTETEVALRDPKLSKARAKELLASNLEEVAKLRQLSEALLRLANGSQQPEMKPVSIKAVADDAVARNAKVAKARKIAISNDVPAVEATGDKESLVELVSILLDNAIKYSQPGNKITLSGGKHGKTTRLSVTDKGIGIQAHDLPYIFDRFYRADTSRSKLKADGYGLGLALAKQLAELHEGSIEVKSIPGKGSTFTLSLPNV